MIEAYSSSPVQVFLVFDFCESNLYEAMTHMSESAKRFSEEHVRYLMSHLLKGLAALHSRNIMHRDVKPDNILLTYGSAKVCDFGQARFFMSTPLSVDMKGPLTDYVATRWYRAPELLLHATAYTAAVDLWAAGCTMAELFLGRPLFPGTSELDQLHRIATALGTPSEGEWPSLGPLCARSGHSLPSATASGMQQLVPGISAEAAELLSALLRWNPAQRPSAQAALAFKFFQSGPSTAVQPVPPARRMDEVLTAQADAKQAQAEVAQLTLAAASGAAAAAATATAEGGQPKAGGGAARPITDSSQSTLENGSTPTNTTGVESHAARGGGASSTGTSYAAGGAGGGVGGAPGNASRVGAARVRPGGMLAGLLGTGQEGASVSSGAPPHVSTSGGGPTGSTFLSQNPAGTSGAPHEGTGTTAGSTGAGALSPSSYVPSFLRGGSHAPVDTADTGPGRGDTVPSREDRKSETANTAAGDAAFGAYVPSFLRD